MFPPPPHCPRFDRPIALSTYAAPAAVVTVDLSGHYLPKVYGVDTIDDIASRPTVSSEDDSSPAYPGDTMPPREVKISSGIEMFGFSAFLPS